MNKLKNNIEPLTLVTVESVEDFFQRGKRTSKLLDQKKTITQRRVISFEDTADLVNFLTKNKLRLVAAIRKHPSSITKLADILHRSRAAIDKDVKVLESVGILKSEYVTNPGHGRYKMVTVVDQNPIQLQVQASL